MLEKLEITDTGTEGQTIAKADGVVCFMKGGVPGDVVDVQVTKKHKRFFEGKIVQYHKRSQWHAEPFCEHFGTCGGCKWQHMQYEAQLCFKQKQVEDAITRIGGVVSPVILPVVPSKETRFYRNKLEYTFSNKRYLTEEEFRSGTGFGSSALGFHIPGLFDKVLDIRNCYLQPEPSNTIRQEIKIFAEQNGLSFYDIRKKSGLLRTLMIRTSSTGEVMVLLVFGDKNEEAAGRMMKHVASKFPQITSLLHCINNKPNDTVYDLEMQAYKGNAFIIEKLGDLSFKISPKSFFQTNTAQAYELYKLAREYSGLNGSETVYDLYTGTGSIANFIARSAKKVIGIESIPEAIEDARENSRLNGITNTAFFAGDMKEVLNENFAARNGRPDLIITDPPRAGMHEAVTHRIAELAPKRIVYVSCNPATQARDIALLKEKYSFVRCRPVDMFPHTAHVENVALLELK